MVEIKPGATSDEMPACPTPEQVPPPLMSEWLNFLDDHDSKIRKISDASIKNQESDTYFLYHPRVPDHIFAVVPLGGDPHDPTTISRINGDRYKDGKRIEYYGQGIIDSAGTLQFIKVDFDWKGDSPIVAKQTVIYAQIDFPNPKDKFVYEAQFDRNGRLTSYLTGTSTGEFGFQTPDSPHYQDYMKQLHPTECHH